VGRRNPSRVVGGRIMAAEMKADSAKKEAAEKLLRSRHRDLPRLELPDDWFRRPVQPSPRSLKRSPATRGQVSTVA
jgi:hypothetical protein